MWDKAIDAFQDKMKEQSDLISHRSRSDHSRSRSPSEISKKSLMYLNGNRPNRSMSNSKGAVISGNDLSAIGAKPPNDMTY